MPSFDLIACDLDGTLLTSKKEIAPATALALRRVRALGTRICLASGRMVLTTRPFAGRIDATAPMVCLNGAYVATDDGLVLRDAPIPPRQTDALLQQLRRHGIYRAVIGREAVWCERLNAQMAQIMQFWVGNLIVVEDFAEVPPDAAYQVIAIAPPAEIAALTEEFRPGQGRDYELFSFPASRDYLAYMELRVLGSHKGVGLRSVQEHLGISRERTLAIGDFWNDVELFREAGKSAAPAQAPEAIRRQVDFVSPGSNNQDGLIPILARFFPEVDFSDLHQAQGELDLGGGAIWAGLGSDDAK